jgi:hypothetical protein
MKIEFIPEPELEFGAGRHIDIRFGLMNYGPFDYASPLAPKEIKLGVVGTNDTIDGVCNWLERCQKGILAKQGNQPKLFPKFPGYGDGTHLPASLIVTEQLRRPIPHSEIDALNQCKDINKRIELAVSFFIDRIAYLVENTPCDVVVCAPPHDMIELIWVQDESNAIKRQSGKLDFHDMLKAQAMKLGHTQIVLPDTYGHSKKVPRKMSRDRSRGLQDEATRAWNFYTALYYKAKGAPWRLVSDTAQFTACYVGVGFYKSLDGSRLHTSVAQVFNERGDGIIVRGGAAKVSKDDKQIHISEADAYQLLHNALETYRMEHLTLPARVIVHKTSTYNDEELRGFQQALNDQRISMSDFLSCRQSYTRLLRNGKYPTLRGTLLCLDDEKHVLYTRGSVDFFETYPGMYIPLPLEFRCEQIEQTPKFLAKEILGLTKMNWNKTQFDSTVPITISAARKVGKILKYVGEDDPIQTRYSYYM